MTTIVLEVTPELQEALVLAAAHADSDGITSGGWEAIIGHACLWYAKHHDLGPPGPERKPC